MRDPDNTLTSPLHESFQRTRAILALTVLWHPDPQYIGAQHFEDKPGAIEVGRFLPLFRHAGQDGLPLGHGGVSRLPVKIRREADGKVSVTPPDSRMLVELNGLEVSGSAVLDAAQLNAGVVLGLGRSILLCLHLANALPQDKMVPGLIGVSSAVRKIRQAIHGVAGTDIAVLVLGETGTGKEVVANAVHALGARADRPLVAVNMAALNDALAAAELFGAAKGAYTGAQAVRVGLFGEADNATLFLDEIGNTPASVQPMLLRVLESGEYRPIGGDRDKRSNARIIAATDQDLSDPAFNQPLLRRLEAFAIHLPALRERREDIGVLIAHLLARSSAADAADAADAVNTALPFEFVSACANYEWPGNVRQLAHVLNRAILALRGGTIPVFTEFVLAKQDGHSVPSSLPVPSARRAIGELTDEDVLAALHRNGWQIQAAARALGISRPSMYKRIEAHPAIRRPEHITEEELARAMLASEGDIERCAALLLSPAEALRRRLRILGRHPIGATTALPPAG